MSFGHAWRLMTASVIVAVGIVILAACSTSHGVRSSPQLEVKARTSGIPATIAAGGAVVEFTATFTNSSGKSMHDVAPLFQIVGGPCNCVLGSLERFDSATSAWRPVPMPEGDGDPDFLARANGGVTLPQGAIVTFRYRLTVDASNPAKDL
jgi:hypothetical protein